MSSGKDILQSMFLYLKITYNQSNSKNILHEKHSCLLETFCENWVAYCHAEVKNQQKLSR